MVHTFHRKRCHICSNPSPPCAKGAAGWDCGWSIRSCSNWVGSSLCKACPVKRNSPFNFRWKFIMNKAMQFIICLIEDDEIMGESLSDRFALEGFRIEWHRTGLEGMRAINNKHFNLVISDIHLPDINGEEIYSRLTAESSSLPPFIFITGYGSIDRAVRLLKLGAADYISKPFDLDQLVEKARQLCPAQISDGNAEE